MRSFLQVLFSTNALNGRVRQTLVVSLYTHPSSLALGAACGVGTSLITAWLSGNGPIAFATLILALIAVLRVGAAAYLLRRTDRHDIRQLELIYETGAWSYAFILGMIAALTLSERIDPQLQLLMVGNAIGYGVGISARNAGRPLIAIGQLFFAILPPIVALLAEGSIAHVAMAVSMVLLLPAMVSIILITFRVLRDSVASAETNARLAEKMQLLARTDVVTGLYNRAGLNHHLVERLMRVQGNRKFALFWLDLDRFKEVNDTLGHPVGDRVLSEIATRLRKQCPPDATIARFGGDEFIIACETDSRAELELLAESLLQAITHPIRIDSDRLEIHSSMGIAMMPDDGNDIDSLMQGADLALYHSKVNGRNQYSFFDPSMTRDLVRRREIESELRMAIQREELSIYFQPIVDLATGRIRSFEALVRWFHPEKGELKPDEFIPVAEETGVIITLGNWITAQAAKTAAQWPDDVTLRQPFAAATARAGRGAGHPERDPRSRAAAVAARAGNYRKRVPRGRRDHRQLHAPARRRRSALCDRRFRDRLFLARLSRQISVRQDQDRPQLRFGDRRRQEERRDHPRGGRNGQLAGDGDCRRRARDGRTGPRSARGGLYAGPRLLFQPRGARLLGGAVAGAGARRCAPTDGIGTTHAFLLLRTVIKYKLRRAAFSRLPCYSPTFTAHLVSPGAIPLAGRNR